MNTETPMNSGAINAEEYSISNGSPSRVLRVAIETHLEKPQKPNNLKIQDPNSDFVFTRSKSDLKNSIQIQDPKMKTNTKTSKEEGGGGGD